jgi:hypothetical protein
MEVIFLPIAIWLVVFELGDSETPPYFKLLLIIAAWTLNKNASEIYRAQHNKNTHKS